MYYYINEYRQKTALHKLKVGVFTTCNICKTEHKFKNFEYALNAILEYQSNYICKKCRTN